MNISQKLLAAFVLALGVFCSALVFLATIEVVELLTDERSNTIHSSVESSAEQNAFIFYSENRPSIEEWLASVIKPEKIKYVAVLDAANNPTLFVDELGFGRQRLSGDLKDSETIPSEEQKHYINIIVDLKLDEEPDTAKSFSKVHVVVANNRTDILKRVTFALATVLGIAILIVWPVLIALSKYLSRPIVELGKQLEAIDPEAAGIQLIEADSGTPKELRVVSETFNTLLERIFDHTTNLDNKVAERTGMLSQALILAEQNEREKHTLISNLSHDLKTPLASITGYLELISDQLDDEEYRIAKHNTAKGMAEAGRMLGEINDILRVSSSQIGESSAVEVTNLRAVCDDVLTSHEVLTTKSGNTINVECLGGTTATINSSVFKHVLDNLVSNANKFCKDGRIEIHIQVDSNVQVSVSDQGQTLPESDLESFFEPKLSSGSRFTLSGIGLFLCRQRLELVGGSITVNNVKPKGICVSFTLPNMDS